MRRAARSFGDRQELVGGDRIAELECVQRRVDGEAGVGQRPQVGDADRCRDGQLVGVAAAGVVVDRAVDRGHPQLRELGGLSGQLAEQRQVGGRAGARPEPDRVGTERAGDLVRGDPPFGHQAQEGVGRLARLHTRVQSDRREIEVDAVERRWQFGDGQTRVAEHKPQ